MAGLFTGRSIFFNFAYLMGMLLILSFVWAFFSVRGVRIERYTRSRRGQVGRQFVEEFQIKNRGIQPKIGLEIHDYSTLPGHRVSQVSPLLWTMQTYRWKVATPCSVRGIFRLGTMTLINGDPFGLFSMQREIPASANVIIYPRTVALEAFHLPMGTLSGGDAQRRWTQQVTTNAAGVRDYVPGDAINRIHWKSTARRNTLIVKEFELDPQVDIWMFVDFSQRSLVDAPTLKRDAQGVIVNHRQETSIPASTEEYAVVVAASIAEHFLQKERALGFTAYTPHRESLLPDRGDRQLTQILELLAVARSKSPRGLAEMLRTEGQLLSRGTSLIIVTASLDLEWITQAQILSGRGVRPTCVFIAPDGFGGAPSKHVREALLMARIPHHIIERYDALDDKLSQTPII